MNIDENALLRFAAGEMNEEEETDFVVGNEIAGESARWRDAVLALVEHRRVNAALVAYAAASSGRSAGAAAPAGRRFFRQTLSIAAAALVAGFLLAWSISPWLQREKPAGLPTMPELAQGGPAASQQATDPQTQVAGPPRLAADEVSLSPAHAPPRQPPDARDGLFGVPPIISESQANALRLQGVQVEQQPTVYILDGGNGRRWAVPAQQATLHYVSKP